MFTKGEWTTRIGFIDCGDKVIADTFSGRKISVAESRANAQLIASAPDMYEALKLTRNNLQTLSDAALHYKKTFSANLKILNQALSKVGER